MSEDDWDAVITVHLKGHFAPSRFACAYWREQSKADDGAPVGGRIINTVSESGLFGMVGQANYSAAKAGIASMTLVLAREMQKYGVTVNAVAPRARTRMTAAVGAWKSSWTPKEGEYDAWHPDNVAPLVAFLASDDAADVSGQVFVMWGAHAYLMSGWTLANDFDAGDRRWTVEELIARKAELFAPVERGSKIPQMGFGLMSPAWGELQVDQLRFMANRYGDEIAYRDLDAGHGADVRGVGRAVEPARPLPGRPGHRARATGSRSTCRATRRCAGSSPTPRRTRPARSRCRPTPGSPCPSSSRSSVTPRSPACITCDALLDNVLALRDRGAVAAAPRERRRRPAAAKPSTTPTRCTPTARTSRCRRASTTSPTSCTRRARRACRRASRSGTATSR